MVALFAFRFRDKTHKIRKIPTNTRHFRSVFRLLSGIQAAVFCPKNAPRLACPGEQIATSALMDAASGDRGVASASGRGRFIPNSMPHGRPFSGVRCRIKPLLGRVDAARKTLGREWMPHKRTFREIRCRMSAGSRAGFQLWHLRASLDPWQSA